MPNGTSRTILTEDNIERLARIIMSEASVGNDYERRAVAWTVRNRMQRNGVIRVELVERAYARNQPPIATIRQIATEVLSANASSDPTRGATHYYSPRSMPKENENTAGYDVGAGLEQVPGLSRRTYRPSWAQTFPDVNIPGVRPAYYKFYRASGNGPVR